MPRGRAECGSPADKQMRADEGWTVQRRVLMERWREKVEEVEGGVEGKGVKLGCSLFTPKFSNLLNHSFPRKK